MFMQILRIMHRTPLVLATALLTSVSAFAQTEISNEAGLKAIANKLDGNYVLTQDITLSDDEWTPIGTSDKPFTGTLDGQGHTINGLTVGNGDQDHNKTNNNDKAFFGFTNRATVQNIAFTNAVVKGSKQAAIVVAQATSSTLNNIYVSGVVTGWDHVGTIAGDARGITGNPTKITNCVSTAAALSTEHQGGGIAGWTNNSIFSNNIAYGTVTAHFNGAGGITGMVDDEGSSSEYTSNISAAPYIEGDNDKTHGINGWCNNKCSNTGSNNLSWAGTKYKVGGNTKMATEITNNSGIHGTVTSTDDLKKVATYTDLGFNTDTWTLEEGKLPQLTMFPNISDAISISGLPDIIIKGETVTVTATSALNRPIEINSSDESIISVDGNTLKAKNYGTCNITFAASASDFAQAGSKTVTITVPGLKVTYHIGDNSEAVTSDVSAVGSLATLLGGKAMDVTQLSVIGYLNDADINLLQKMAGSEGTGKLKSLNLSEATFMSTRKKVPDYIFQNCKNLQQVDLSGMTAIGIQAFQNCALTEISIPATVTRIEKGAFAGNKAVTKVIVHSAQIDARSYDGEENIFYGMEPNDVQVVFVGDAEDHYKNYRNDIVDADNSHHKNAFMYLLTKTLDEDDEDYTVVAQRHADVLLKRTFKAGWNTLVLPFGARYLENDPEPSCASIFKRALNASNKGNFMIAAYRGLSKKKNNGDSDNRTFYFLKYADYNKDPLDEFEPLLIRMTQEDIDDANGVYTFKNVELNYDGDNNTTYTAEEAKGRMGKRENGKYFDGSYDTNANDKFKNSSYDEFYFTGTLYKQDTDKNPDFIAPGDYIIQNNTFVKCLSGKKYGLKGFRGYFKQKPSDGTSGGTSGAKGIGICLVDRNGVVSSIHQVDGVSLTPASVAPVAVYNLSGQKVGNSLSTLAKGVYIVNGKKFVKK